MRILFALPGAHRVNRGAEVAIESIARNIARHGDGDEVVLIGSGPQRPSEPYRYEQVKVITRERFEWIPELPLARNPEMWEELTFIPGMLRRLRKRDFDITVTCTFPYVNLALRRWRRASAGARHVWISENGIWPLLHDSGEARWFGCDAVVCINPEYQAEALARGYPATLIPNGVDVDCFSPGPGERHAFGLPDGVPIVLMVSALIASKHVAEGVRAVAEVPDAMLVVAGDGIRRAEIDALAEGLLPGRYRRLVVPSAKMPDLYRCADAFLHLSRDEAFGNAYVEAMVTGLPCVVHDYPLTRWIYGEHGILIDTTDRDALVDALLTAVGSAPGERAAQVARGRATFSWKTIAERYRALFAETLAR